MSRAAAFTPGIRDMLGASLLFACMSLLVKLATENLPPAHPMLARSIVGLLITYLLLRRLGQSPRGSRPLLLGVRGAVGFAALLCNFHALSLMPLGDALVIFQTHPVWTALMAALFLGERLTRRVLVGCAIALSGVTLVAQPTWLFGGVAASVDPLGPILAITASVLAAGAYVAVRALRRTDPPLVVVFWFALIATPGSLPGVIADPVLPSAGDWLLLGAIGLTVQGAQMLMTRALHREPAGRVAVTGYSQIAFGFVLGVLFLDERPGPLSIAGAVLVIAGALVVTMGRRPTAPRPEAPEAPEAIDSHDRSLDTDTPPA